MHCACTWLAGSLGAHGWDPMHFFFLVKQCEPVHVEAQISMLCHRKQQCTPLGCCCMGAMFTTSMLQPPPSVIHLQGNNDHHPLLYIRQATTSTSWGAWAPWCYAHQRTMACIWGADAGDHVEHGKTFKVQHRTRLYKAPTWCNALPMVLRICSTWVKLPQCHVASCTEAEAEIFVGWRSVCHPGAAALQVMCRVKHQAGVARSAS